MWKNSLKNVESDNNKDPYKGRIMAKCTSHRCVCKTQNSIIFQVKTYTAKTTGTGGGKEVQYTEMDHSSQISLDSIILL